MSEKNRVTVECSDEGKTAKATILKRSEQDLVVEFPTGWQMILKRKQHTGQYLCQLGFLEFVSDGKPIK